MGFYTERVFPHLMNKAMDNRDVRTIRSMATEGLEGSVVEVGFGTGLNARHYPPWLRKVYAVEPSETARRLSARQIERTPVPVELVGVGGESLPFEDDSMDSALTTWVLCSIPEVESALAEIYRVLKPGGRFHFADHGRHPDQRVARWQDRLNGLQRKLCGGCNINRKIDDLVADAGFEVPELRHPGMPGPDVETFLYVGVGVKPVPGAG